MIIFHAMTIVYRDYINISIITKCNADYTFVLNKKGYALISTNRNLSMLIFFVENNIHLIIHSFYLSGSVIAHFFVQMKISALLQNSIQAPVI